MELSKIFVNMYPDPPKPQETRYVGARPLFTIIGYKSWWGAFSAFLCDEYHIGFHVRDFDNEFGLIIFSQELIYSTE